MVEIADDVGAHHDQPRHQPAEEATSTVLPTEALLKFVEERNALGELLGPAMLPMLVPPEGVECPSRQPLPVRQRVAQSAQAHRAQEGQRRRVPQGAGHAGCLPGTECHSRPPRGASTSKSSRSSRRSGMEATPVPGIPSRDNIKIPPYPASPTEEEKRTWQRRGPPYPRRQRQSQGTRLQVSMSLDLAEKFSNEEAIYYPHKLDFRSRAYPDAIRPVPARCRLQPLPS